MPAPLTHLSATAQIASVAGDPATLMASARRLAAVAVEIQGSSSTLKSNVASVIGSDGWKSFAATQFQVRAGTLAAADVATSQCCALAAQALATYALELGKAQEVATAAIAARGEVERARATHNAKVTEALGQPDGGASQAGALTTEQGRISAAGDAATKLGADAHQIAKDAARAAAAQLHEATAAIPVKVQEAVEAANSKESAGHTVLDVLGLVPLIGDPADGANAIWYGAEGDAANASLSAVGLVPGLGEFAVGGKLIGKGVKGAKAVEKVTKIAKDAEKVTKRAMPEWLKRGMQWHRDVQKQVIEGGGVKIAFVDSKTSMVIGGSSDWNKELHVYQATAADKKYFKLDLQSADYRVSLKSGQYPAHDPEATKRLMNALDEMDAKYGPSKVAADVPSTPQHLRGGALAGDGVLGIPVQASELHPDVLEHARDLGIKIGQIDVPVR